MKKINLNAPVKVILSERGAQIINAELETMQSLCPNCTDFAKRYKKGDEMVCQLWSLMNTFGKSMIAGDVCSFEDADIFIEDKSISEAE